MLFATQQGNGPLHLLWLEGVSAKSFSLTRKPQALEGSEGRWDATDNQFCCRSFAPSSVAHTLAKGHRGGDSKNDIPALAVDALGNDTKAAS